MRTRSPRRVVVKVVNAVLEHAGLRLSRVPKIDRLTHPGFLAQLRALGLRPGTVFDVGAAYGEWSRACSAEFPDARFILVEPLEEFAAALEKVAAQLSRSSVIKLAGAASGGTAELHVHRDLVGSSLLREAEGGATDGAPRVVGTTTIDELAIQAEAEGPFWIKLDVQGAELDVLSGARRTLETTDMVLMEVSLLPFFFGGPVLHDVVAYMRDAGFVVYDILGPTYRPLDEALGQVDIAFVPVDSEVRSDHRYASPEQRREQDERFRRYQGTPARDCSNHSIVRRRPASKGVSERNPNHS
jgi:methyltransferase, FkbM family